MRAGQQLHITSPDPNSRDCPVALRAVAVIRRTISANNRSASPTRRSASPKTPSALPPRPRSPASMWSAPSLPAAHSDAPTGQARGLAAHATVRVYKSLSGVEHAFRALKTVDLELRPVFHWTAPRVRTHVLLCMLAHYLHRHMRRSLAPMLFDEPDPAARAAHRPRRWPRPNPHRRHNARPPANAPIPQSLPLRKRGRTTAGAQLSTLLGDLATLTRNVSASGAIASPPSSPPTPPSAAPSICSDLHSVHRQTDACGRKLYPWRSGESRVQFKF